VELICFNNNPNCVLKFHFLETVSIGNLISYQKGINEQKYLKRGTQVESICYDNTFNRKF
jgi:hypothetical protein